MIHSLDRPKLALALKGEAERGGRTPSLFIQVNIGEEPQKAGVSMQGGGRVRVAGARRIWSQGRRVDVHSAGGWEAPAPYFALLAKLARENALPHLSMGMSDDFETAIRYGATHVRVGSAIFGARS